MDRWIALHEGVTGPKLRDFAKLAGCPESEALGILSYLWLWAVKDNADSNGLLMKADLKDIADVFALKISKSLDPMKVAQALVDAGWIDEVEGHYFVHDWPEHQDPWVKYIKKKEAANERKRRERDRKAMIAALQSGVPAGAPDELPPAPPGDPPDEQSDPPEETAPEKPKGSSYTPSFEQFWSMYPRKDEKGNAYKKYLARLNDGFSEAELLEAATAYAAQCKQQRTEKKYIKLGKTFLSDSTPFTDFLRKEDGGGQRSSSGPPGAFEYNPGSLEGSL